MIRKIGFFGPLLVLAALAHPASAQSSDAIFGPESFALTSDGTETHSVTFTSEAEGELALFLRNGDGEGGRVNAGSVSLNGATVEFPAELTGETQSLRAYPVFVVAGENELVVDLEGRPGAFVTIAIGTRQQPPVFVQGRLLLPWGVNGDERLLRLALKNDSRDGPRRYRVIFFNPSGEVAAASDTMALPPMGSVVFAVDEVIAQGDWTAGSIEIIYTGPGRGRLLGHAHQIDHAPIPQSDIEALVQGGYSVAEPRPQPSDGRFPRGARF